MSEDLARSIYEGRKDYGYDRTEGRKMLAADWSVPLHRCLRRIYELRTARPDLDPIIINIWRDLNTAIGRSGALVKQLGIDTSSPLRRKPGASQPQPVKPEFPANEFPLAGTPANPIRANIARALNRLAAAIAPAGAPCSTLPASSPVAPHNEPPKGPNT